MNQSQQFRHQAPVQPAPRPRIDPDQIPSPVAVQEADQEEWDQKPFVTSLRTSPTPLASSDFMAIDGGMYRIIVQLVWLGIIGCLRQEPCSRLVDV